MKLIATKTRNAIVKGAVLAALLTAGQAFADPEDTAGSAAVKPDQARTRSVQGLGSNNAFERQRFSSRPAVVASSPNAKRVYLEDYQRVPQAVARKHPTQPHVLGQGKGGR